MNNEIILYRPNELADHIEVQIKENTVWLNQDQLAQLFNRDQSVISRHIKNVFNEGELEVKSNMQKMHTPNSDKPVAFFNLDVMYPPDELHVVVFRDIVYHLGIDVVG